MIHPKEQAATLSLSREQFQSLFWQICTIINRENASTKWQLQICVVQNKFGTVDNRDPNYKSNFNFAPFRLVSFFDLGLVVTLILKVRFWQRDCVNVQESQFTDKGSFVYEKSNADRANNFFYLCGSRTVYNVQLPDEGFFRHFARRCNHLVYHHGSSHIRIVLCRQTKVKTIGFLRLPVQLRNLLPP
jgi:hypothetical protein